MSIRKIIFILLLPVIAEIIVSCCDCAEVIFKNYTNESVLVKNLDNSGQDPVVSVSNSIDKDAYGIRVEVYREITAFNKKTTPTFFQSAYATSCQCPPPEQFFPIDSVMSIKIFTLNDFDLAHSADSDISDYFKVYQQYFFRTINDYLKSTPNGYGNSSLVLYDESELEIKVDLLLMTVPTINDQHRFKVEIILSDGRILELETPEIELI